MHFTEREKKESPTGKYSLFIQCAVSMNGNESVITPGMRQVWGRRRSAAPFFLPRNTYAQADASCQTELGGLSCAIHNCS